MASDNTRSDFDIGAPVDAVDEYGLWATATVLDSKSKKIVYPIFDKSTIFATPH